MGALRFIRDHVVASLVGAAAAVLTVLGYLDQGRDILSTFEAWEIQAVAAGLFVVAVGMMLYKMEQKLAYITVSDPKAEQVAELRRKRAHVITAGRALVTGFTQLAHSQSLREYLEAQGEYLRLRPHLSQEFISKLHQQRTAYAIADGSALHPLARMLADELDRLEREWGLI